MKTTNLTAMRSMARRFLQDQSAATAIEYGLLASLIAVAIVVGAGALGSSLNTTFDNISKQVTPAS
jgi:pilus assembly protein Flp/PilA